MAHKRPQRAVCPRFIARVDFRGQSAIHCEGKNVLYFNRNERDADYMAACCGDPALCPLKRVPAKTIVNAGRSNGKSIPCLWPTTPSYPTVDALTQEAQHHERD